MIRAASDINEGTTIVSVTNDALLCVSTTVLYKFNMEGNLGSSQPSPARVSDKNSSNNNNNNNNNDNDNNNNNNNNKNNSTSSNSSNKNSRNSSSNNSWQ